MFMLNCATQRNSYPVFINFGQTCAMRSILYRGVPG